MSFSEGRYRGATVLVTGAASGIGLAIAEQAAAEGAHVCATDIVPVPGGRQSVDGPGTVQDLYLDVTEERDWRRVAEHLERQGRTVSHFFCHGPAQVVPPTALDKQSPQQWRAQLSASLDAAFLGFRALAPMLQASSGSMVVTSSVHALAGIPGHAAYAAAKAGLLGLVRQLAVEYAPAIRVNAVVPGPIDTAAWRDVSSRDRERSVQATPLARFGRPEEVAAAALFLASEDASFVTGASLVVDGGWSIARQSA